jgi:hypothetical protein
MKLISPIHTHFLITEYGGEEFKSCYILVVIKDIVWIHVEVLAVLPTIALLLYWQMLTQRIKRQITYNL